MAVNYGIKWEQKTPNDEQQEKKLPLNAGPNCRDSSRENAATCGSLSNQPGALNHNARVRRVCASPGCRRESAEFCFCWFV